MKVWVLYAKAYDELILLGVFENKNLALLCKGSLFSDATLHDIEEQNCGYHYFLKEKDNYQIKEFTLNELVSKENYMWGVS